MTAVPLEHALEEALFGGKAVQLGAALRAGLPVPPGLALSWELARAVGAEESSALESVRAAHQRLGGALAVRSSAVGEDSAGASFAGIHLSLVNVRDERAVVDAVRATWASGHAEAALAYRRRMGASEAPRVAVVLQRFVDAEVAGVVFTRNPVTGADERVIEGSWGLGESVVSGLVTPDHVRASRDGRILELRVGTKDLAIRPAPEGGTHEVEVPPDLAVTACLTDDLVRRLLELAATCERLAGRAVDLEWALAGGRLHLLQQRPVTTA